MKARKVILSLFVMLMLFGQIGHAASNQKIQVSMNGTNVSVTQVPIIMDGQAVDTQIPSFIYVDRTLVPIRFVAENYGATVDWDQKTKTATVTHENKEMKLTIDSSIAMIDNEKVVLDKNSTPRLVTFANKDARTMVPLSFVSQILGYEVGWDEINKVPYINSKKDVAAIPDEDTTTSTTPVKDGEIGVIDSIYFSKGSTDKNKLIINGNKSFQYDTMYLESSKKIVIDIKDAKLSLKDTKDTPGSLPVEDDIIESIRFSQFSYNPMITRVVVTLKEDIVYNISPYSGGMGLVVSLGTNKISSITREFIEGKEAIVVQGAGDPKMNFMKLKNPERVVIDLMDSTLEGSTYFSYEYDLGFVKRVRVSQFSADNNYSSADQIVRIVLDVKDGISDPSVKVDTYEDKIVIYPEKSFWENISYVSEEDYKIFTVNALTETQYFVNHEQGSKWIELTIPNSNIELNEGIVSIKDGLVDEIEVIKDEIDTKIFIKFNKSIDYTVLSNEIDKQISLKIKKNENIKSSERLIVIDPGHGGKAPGTTSVTKKYEKDLNLTLSLKLNERLEALGYNTIMTRDTDVDVDLYERARIANENYADIFVSIHGNAHNDRSIHGIQVLYCPATKSDLKEVDQHPFAKVIMDELLAGTGAQDKGIIQRPNLVVLRETKMPAVLIEVGFMSNAEEEKLLFTETYQEKIIDSIIKGIEKYFEMY